MRIDLHSHSDASDGTRPPSEVVRRAREAEVGVYPIAPYYLTPPDRAGLLLGYANLSEEEIREGVRRLAAVMKALR